MDPLEDLRADLEELSRDPFNATVGANVGYLLGGQFRTWDRSDDLDAVLSEIARATEFLDQYSSMDRLADAFLLHGTGGARVYQSVPLELLAGDEAKVKELLARSTSLECRVPGLVCEHFRRFERNAIDYLDGQRH